ncbi:DUF3592 domain-containing protein [Streptomyces hokutonensis]|uniref:DUF3592 domain-containing protein n=1 Tax=Streptomyces hokutonensis TaxID=1306990 RepID=A0ABW6M9G4_9ACTN
MSVLWQSILVLGGLLLIGLGVREAWTQRRMGCFGVRVEGVVVRLQEAGRGGDFKERTYAPVIRFPDEHGVAREFVSTVRGTRKPEVGIRVPVVHLPGSPGTARLDTLGHKASALAISFGVGVLFLAVGVVLG